MDASGLLGIWRLGALELLAGLSTVSLIFYELGNAFWKMHRSAPAVWSRDNYIKTLRFVNAAMDIVEPEYEEVLRISMEMDLTFYDSAYLWLARERGEPILTLDSDFSSVWDVVSPEELVSP